MKFITYLSKLLFVIGIVAFLFSTNIRWASSSVYVYDFLFEITKVEQTSEIPKQELMRGAKQIISYVDSAIEPLEVIIQVDGQDKQVYSEREVSHMKDVKELFRKTYRVQEFAGIYLLLFSVVSFCRYRAKAFHNIAILFAMGGAATVCIVLLVGLSAVLISFQEVFNIFHFISFDNDLWILSPDTYLVRMYPYNFWLNATFLIGLSTIIQGVFIICISAISFNQRRRVNSLTSSSKN